MLSDGFGEKLRNLFSGAKLCATHTARAQQIELYSCMYKPQRPNIKAIKQRRNAQTDPKRERERPSDIPPPSRTPSRSLNEHDKMAPKAKGSSPHKPVKTLARPTLLRRWGRGKSEAIGRCCRQQALKKQDSIVLEQGEKMSDKISRN